MDETIASKQGDKLSEQLESMRVPEYQTWFPATFGSDNGPKLAARYSESPPERGKPVGGVFQQTFDKAVRDSLIQPRVFYEVQYGGKLEKTPLSVRNFVRLRNVGERHLSSDSGKLAAGVAEYART